MENAICMHEIAKTDYPELAKSLIAFKMASLKLGLLWQS